jgi:2-dehydro-3-deoxyglucarate aldolase/4-hydroxy-2-oxoheptanedioate aldolase
MQSNWVKAALKEGKRVYGSEVSRLRSPEVPQLYAAAGLDFVFIDMEHTAFNLETVADMIRSARAAGIVPLVRVPQAEYVWVARVLDQGARGIIVPRVNTARQAADVVSWMRYPPQGIRGFACTAAQTDHSPMTPEAFIAANHSETLCVIQVERGEALDNLEEMLAVSGVDVACLGYMDLSVDLGIPGQLEHPTMVHAVERLIAVADAHGVAPGIIHPRIDVITRWMAAGMRFISHATEFQLLQEAAAAAVRRLRSAERDLIKENGVASA